METIVFYLLASITVFAAWVAVTVKGVVHSIIAFAVLLVGVAGFLGLLQIPFLAIGQLMIFVGGMISLLLFGVMFNKETEPTSPDAIRPSALPRGTLSRVIAIISFFACILFSFSAVLSEGGKVSLVDYAHFSRILFHDYWEGVLLGFFALFVAVVTAVFLLQEE